jgi:hypothetical protein
VDNYEDGKVVDHDGAWLLGRHTETPGVAMPPDPPPDGRVELAGCS